MPSFVIKEDRNIMVTVGEGYFRRLGIILKNKACANPDELSFLNEALSIMKTLPEAEGQYIYLKYIKLLKMRGSIDIVRQTNLDLSECKQIIGKTGSKTEIEEILGLSRKELNRLEKSAFNLFADKLLTERLKNCQLIKEQIESFIKFICVEDIQCLTERLKQTHSADDTEVEIIDQKNNKAIICIRLFQYKWINKEELERRKSNDSNRKINDGN